MGKMLEQRMTPATPVPALRNGQMLDTTEFLRRYEATPEGTRAELLDGVVWLNRWLETDETGTERVMPPISGSHSQPQGAIVTMLSLYAAQSPGVIFDPPRTVVLNGQKSAVEPDAILRLDPDCGGSARPGTKGWLYGAPELILEVAHSSINKDLGSKRSDYERYGVMEYLVWQTEPVALHWFHRVKGQYELRSPDAAGIIHSTVFPTFRLNIAALLEGRLKECVDVLLQSIGSPEHAKFVEKLRRAKARKK